MKTKIVLSFIVFILFMSGCTKKDESTNTTPSEAMPAKIPTPATIYAPQAIAAAINNGSLSRQEGLTQLKTWYDNAREGNTEEQLKMASTLTEIINSINEGNPVTNLAEVLGAEVFSQQLPDQLQISDLFAALNEQSEQVRLTEGQLLLLIEFLNTQNRRTPNNDLVDRNIERFFQKRMTVDLKQGRKDIFSIYSALSPSILSRTRFVKLMLPLIPSLKISSSMPGRMQIAFQRILKESLFGNTIEIDSNFIQNSISHASWGIGQLENFSGKGVDLEVIYSSLDYLNTLLIVYTGENQAVVGELSDQAIAIMYKFQKNLRARKLRPFLMQDSIEPAHPYTKIYYYRGLIEQGLKEKFQAKLPKEGPEAYIAFIGQFDEELKQPQFSSLQPYIEALYKVERARFFLEVHARLGASVKKHDDFRNTIYDEALWNAFKALNLRHNRNFSPLEIFSTTRSHLGPLATHVRPETGAHEIYLCSSPSDNRTCEDSGEFLIPADVYILNNNTKIFAGNVIFHPLAVMLAPGKNIFFRANNIENPWLDVSGKYAPIEGRFKPQDTLAGENGGRIELIINQKAVGFPLLVARGAHGLSGRDGRLEACEDLLYGPSDGGKAGDGGIIDLAGNAGLHLADYQNNFFIAGGQGGFEGKHAPCYEIGTGTPAKKRTNAAAATGPNGHSGNIKL